MDEEYKQEQSVPVLEEELVTGTREVKTGSIRVRKEVEQFEKTVDISTMRDVVKVSRVSINRPVTVAPPVREEGDVLIVPVIEEEIVVETRLILKEEIHIQRRRVKETVTKTVTLGREHATVERLDSEGQVVASSKPRRESSGDIVTKRRSMLD